MTDVINEFSLVELEIDEWMNVFNNLAAITENENFFWSVLNLLIE